MGKDFESTTKLLPEIELKPIKEEDRDCLMSLKDFISACRSNAFIDYDGIGYLATYDGESDIKVKPSDVTEGVKFPEWVEYIMWYNR